MGTLQNYLKFLQEQVPGQQQMMNPQQAQAYPQTGQQQVFQPGQQQVPQQMMNPQQEVQPLVVQPQPKLEDQLDIPDEQEYDPEDEKLDQYLESFSPENFQKYLQEIPIVITADPLVAGTFLAAIIAYLIYKFQKMRREILDKQMPRCKKLSGKEKDLCIAEARLKLYKNQLQVLRSTKAKCSKSNDKQKCIQRINKLEQKIMKKIEKITETINKLKR